MEKPLHILQVTNRLPWPLNDGGNLATYNVTRHLHEAGHRVTLVSLNTQKHHTDPAHLADVATVHAVDIDTSIRPLHAFLYLFRSLPYNIARFQSADFTAKLREVLVREQPDLVQLEGSYQALFIPAIRAAVPNIPIILRSHNVEWKIWQRVHANEQNPLKKWYYGQLYRKIEAWEKETLHDFDAVIAITEEDADWYRAQGFGGSQKEIRTIPAGVDLRQYERPEGELDHRKVGFIGSMEWEPNVQGTRWLVEEVWPEVQAAEPMAELHLAGKNPADWMREWGQVPGVTFHGMVPDAAEFMAAAGIFAVPLLAGGGMRLKIVEALAMGRCVVSTSVGAEGIALRPGVDYVRADGAGEFRREMLDLLGDPERAARIAESGYRRVREKYDWAHLIQHFVELYREML